MTEANEIKGSTMPRGRKKTNPKLLEAGGSYKSNPSRQPVEEIAVRAGTPTATPLVLSNDIALGIWNNVIDLLVEMEIVNQTDVFLIEAFVLNYANYLHLQGTLMKEGFTVAGKDGDIKKHPNTSTLKAAQDLHIRYMSELGLTPSARARMASPTGNKADDPVAKLLEGLKG